MNKEELIALAKELSELEDLSSRHYDVLTIKREARKFDDERDDDSFKDKELNDLFNKYYKVIIQKDASLSSNAFDTKTSLIKQAKALLEMTDLRKATEKMNQLFDEFKVSGRCTKEQDDEFWTEFKSIKDQLFELKKAHYEKVQAEINASKEKKEALIKEADEVAASSDVRSAAKRMNELMDEWKKVGFAGKENNEALYQKFAEIRKNFFEKKKQYDEDMKKVFVERVASKEAIIKKARILLANSTFSDEEVNSMKSLKDEWKAVGFAGKENEDSLWKQFKEISDKYFSEMRFYKD